MFFLEDMVVKKKVFNLIAFYPNDLHLYYLTIISHLQYF